MGEVHITAPDLPPPSSEVGVTGWLRKNLFSSYLNGFLTIFSLWLVWELIPPLLDWVIFEATLSGETREHEVLRLSGTRVVEGADDGPRNTAVCWHQVHQAFAQQLGQFTPDHLDVYFVIRLVKQHVASTG